MKANTLQAAVILVLAGALLMVSGCGGGAENDYGYGPISVLTATPNTVCGPVPTPIVIGGLDFSQIVGDGTEGLPVPETTVTFMAVSPIFLGGTSDRVEVRGQITSDTTIAVTTPPAVICGPASVQASVMVTLPSGVFARSGNIITFVAPTLGTLTVAGGGTIFPAAIPTPYTITVNGTCDLSAWAGQAVHVHWQTDAGNPPLFGGPVGGAAPNPFVGTNDDIITPAAIDTNGDIVGLSPLAVVCEPGAAAPHVVTATIDKVTFPGGSCSANANTLATGFRAPTINTILNDSGNAPHTGLAEFAAALPESFEITGADFGPSGGVATVVFTEAGGNAIFEGGTTATTTVQADIVSDTVLQGISPPASVCGVASASVNVSVILPGGSCTPNTVPSTFFAPTYTSIANIAYPALGTDFDAMNPELFRVTGVDFGPVGGSAVVRFTSTNALNMFLDQTSTTFDVVGTIIDRNTIEGTSPPAYLCPTLGVADNLDEPIDLDVILEGGSCTATAATATTIHGPALVDYSVTGLTPAPITMFGSNVPSTLPLAIDEKGQITITGTGFGPAGNTVTIRFTDAAGGTMFDGNLTVDIPGTVIDRTTINSDPNTFPTITAPRLTVDSLAHLTAILLDPTLDPPADGSCAHAQNAFNFVAPPTITTLVNSDNGLGNGFEQFLGDRFIGCVSSTMTITGTGFDDGGVGNETETYIYDQNQGLDASAMPVRRIGTLNPAGNDLGLPAPGVPAYTVTAPTTITGETRTEALLAELDTDGNGQVTFVIRVINPVDNQFHDFTPINPWLVESPDVNLSLVGATGNTNNNVGVTLDPSSFTDDFQDGTGTPDTVNGFNAVVVSSDDPTGFVQAGGDYIVYTRDGGENWQVGASLQTADGLGGPPNVQRDWVRAQFDHFGNLFVVYRLIDFLAGTTSIRVARSTDQGASWVGAATIDTGTVANLDRPWIAVGDADATAGPGNPQAIYVSWINYDPQIALQPEQVRLALVWVSTALGAVAPGPPFVQVNQQPPQIGLFPFQFGFVDAKCAVGPDGEVYVGWTEFDVLNATSLIEWQVDRDGLNAGTYLFQPTDVLLANNVANFGAIPAQPNTAGGFPQFDLAVVQAGSNKGRVVFAWEELSNPAPFVQNKQVVSGYSDDFGQTTIQNFVVSQTNNADQFLPSLVSDPVTGLLYVTWYDTKDDTTGFNTQARLYAASSATGLFWGDALMLAQAPSDATVAPAFTDYGLNTGLSVWNGCVLAGWADNRNGGVMEAFVEIYQQTDDATP